MGREAESSAREKMREWMAGSDFVGRDEFEAVKAMAAAARDENEALKARIATLEARLGGSPAPQDFAETEAGSQVLSEEEIHEERDDGAPIEVLEQYFEARGWACERTAEGEIVASATGSWAQYELRGVWRPEDQVLQFLAFPDIKVAPEKRARDLRGAGPDQRAACGSAISRCGRDRAWSCSAIRPSSTRARTRG